MSLLIIYIDKSIGEHLQKIDFTPEELMLFSDLALAHFRKQCLLCGELESVKSLSRRLGEPHSATYTYVADEYSTTRSVVETVSVVAVFSYDESPKLPAFLDNKAVIVPVSQAAQSNMKVHCALVCEHLDDCRFYTALGWRYCNDQKISGINISFSNELGGGSSIGVVLEKCVSEDKKFSIGICDADIRFGKTKTCKMDIPKGATYRSFVGCVRQLSRMRGLPPYAALYPNVHEIENLIPTEIIEEISRGNPTIAQGLEVLRKIGGIRGGEPALYYDFKDGIDIEALVEEKDRRKKEYWEEIKMEAQVSCLPGLGAGILGQAVKKLVDQEQYKSVVIDEYLKNLWSEIGCFIYSWGCCSQGISV